MSRAEKIKELCNQAIVNWEELVTDDGSLFYKYDFAKKILSLLSEPSGMDCKNCDVLKAAMAIWNALCQEVNDG